MATEETMGKVVRFQKSVDLDFAFGIVNILYKYMTEIKEGKLVHKEQAVAAASKSVGAEGEVAEVKKVEEVVEEPEISFKDAFAALKPIATEVPKEEVIKKARFDGKSVKVLGSTFEPGTPEEREAWRGKLTSREDEVKYLRTALRYWYSDDWYGSERRKKPA